MPTKKKTPSTMAGTPLTRDWFRRFHPGHYSFWPFLFLWVYTGDAIRSAQIVTGALVLLLLGYLLVWWRTLTNTLAAAGQPIPGFWEAAG